MKILVAALAILTLLAPPAALATTQFPEKIFVNGQQYPLLTLPLEQYYGPSRPRPQLRWPNTATWRGYIGTWEIKGGALYLKSIRAWTEQGEAGLEYLFPGHRGPVPATWFTGVLKVAQGDPIRRYVPYPIYEKYLMITVEKGKVIRQEISVNAGKEGLMW